jgi:hypothetical protein
MLKALLELARPSRSREQTHQTHEQVATFGYMTDVAG